MLSGPQPRSDSATSGDVQPHSGAQPDSCNMGFSGSLVWRLRIATTSSAAGATARIAVVVRTGCGFLSGGRRGASLEDREDCFGRATVALTRAIKHTYIVSPIDMAGMIGMAQTLAVYHYGYHTLKNRLVQYHEPKREPSDAEACPRVGTQHTLYVAR